ncbi:hypothetical protein TIFTF001_001787 [Ficus carica]|uniref:Uncharacterized protein n=1 Tax=Ficus carica TaxID=3494 RepID=A0AA88CR00_FICCA|nr:hypothetical protein TIFTF001_001787 [Ficus carica]
MLQRESHIGYALKKAAPFKAQQYDNGARPYLNRICSIGSYF